MAISVAARVIRDAFVAGGKQFKKVTVTFDNSYPTGGYALTKAQLGFPSGGTIDDIKTGNASTGHMLFWDAANSKLKAFSAAGTELANASAALNGATATLLVIGN